MKTVQTQELRDAYCEDRHPIDDTDDWQLENWDKPYREDNLIEYSEAGDQDFIPSFPSKCQRCYCEIDLMLQERPRAPYACRELFCPSCADELDEAYEQIEETSMAIDCMIRKGII